MRVSRHDVNDTLARHLISVRVSMGFLALTHQFEIDLVK